MDTSQLGELITPQQAARLGSPFHYHWGIILHTDHPTTGVYSGHDLASWAYDDMQPANCASCQANCEEEELPDDWCDCCETTDWLLGAWTGDKGDDPDPAGPWSAYYDSNDNIVQVIASTTIRYGRMASPCYPGQVDARLDDPAEPDDEHPQAYYAIPPDDLRTAEE